MVAQTVLDELVAGVAMYSVFLHSNALRHAVLLCDRSAWYWPSGQLAHSLFLVLRNSPALQLRLVVVVTVVTDVVVDVNVTVVTVAVVVVVVAVVIVEVVAVVVGGGGPVHHPASLLVQKQK